MDTAQHDQPTDAQLVAGARGARPGGERAAAFEAIASRHRGMVLAWCAWHVPGRDAALDVGQSTFEAAFTSLNEGKGPG